MSHRVGDLARGQSLRGEPGAVGVAQVVERDALDPGVDGRLVVYVHGVDAATRAALGLLYAAEEEVVRLLAAGKELPDESVVITPGGALVSAKPKGRRK